MGYNGSPQRAFWLVPSVKHTLASGFEQGMPTSALLALYGWRRVMRDCGRYIPDLIEVRGVLKGICARYKARWGDDAFIPERKQPFSSTHMLDIIAILTANVTVLIAWTATLRAAMLTAFCYVISTGARKDEWTASFEGDTFARRANFAWVDRDGNDLPSTPEVIASRKNGDQLRGKSAPSKCDRLNIEWGGRDMWFRYDDSNPLNFAWRWRASLHTLVPTRSRRARTPGTHTSSSARDTTTPPRTAPLLTL